MSLEVVTKMGAAVWEWGMLYKSVFHMVVLYGSNIWVIKGYMLIASTNAITTSYLLTSFIQGFLLGQMIGLGRRNDQ